MTWCPPASHEVTDRRLGTEVDARRLLFRLKFFLVWELHSPSRSAYGSVVGGLGPQPSKKTGDWAWGSGPRAAGVRRKGSSWP